MGDQSWHRVLDEHDRTARWIVEKYRGSLVRTTGDGILATFDGPGRAITLCAGFRDSGHANRTVPAGRPPYRGGRKKGPGYWWYRRSCRSARDGALRPGRSSRLKSGNGPGSGRGAEIRRAGFARAQGFAGPLGPVRRKQLAEVKKATPSLRWEVNLTPRKILLMTTGAAVLGLAVPGSQLADTEDLVSVDVELVIAVDVSWRYTN